MAAAEARAAWQRMANRCIVQEDAKRAPKLACCPTSASLFHQDPTAGATANKADQPSSTFIPPCWNPSDVGPLPPDAKWWLHVQPNLGATREHLEDPKDVDPLTVDPTGLILDDDLKAKPGIETGFLVSCKGVDLLTPLEPWWRISDVDELASLVAQRSLECIENCDLPRPQRVHFCAGATYSPSYRWSNCPAHLTVRSDSPLEKGLTQPETDPVRVDLLEALRRSQTRAREAEMAAQQAHIEKEKIVDLFFKQASSLFAYRQWVQMLQLENFFLRAKMRAPRSKSTPGPKKRSLGQLTCGLCEYAVAVAVSVGLAAAGVLFGWTLGWLLPVF
ncbi:uncharacterized protein LOC144709479 [Wolffia australiana]